MEFRSYSDLANTMTNNLWRIPADVDLVVSIPRSGIIPATMIALARNLPVTDVDGLVSGRIIQSGQTRRFREIPVDLTDCRHALVVDDSVLSGDSLRRVQQRITAAQLPFRISYAAVYVTEHVTNLVDVHFEVCPLPRLFEWNYLHHGSLRQACVDLDGVLCASAAPEQLDDEALYLAFIKEAPPHIIPTARIRHLVTRRPEHYRQETEAWLERHHVHYDRLSMIGGHQPLAVGDSRDLAVLKAEIFRADEGAAVFVEGNPDQAMAIARLSGKPAISVLEHRLYHPDPYAMVTLQHRARSFSGRLRMRWDNLVRRRRRATPASGSPPVGAGLQVSLSSAKAAAKGGVLPAATASSAAASSALTRGQL
jgi:uncharacterized HAD superfamily protein/orotate phosphoribosyltransferase